MNNVKETEDKLKNENKDLQLEKFLERLLGDKEIMCVLKRLKDK